MYSEQIGGSTIRKIFSDSRHTHIYIYIYIYIVDCDLDVRKLMRMYIGPVAILYSS